MASPAPSIDPLFAGALIDNAGPIWARKKVLWKRLRKFCLWHRLLLRTIGSPLVTHEGSVSLFDIATAVGICRLKFGDCRIRRPRAMMMVVKAQMIFGAIFKKPKDGMNPIQMALKPHLEAFVEYAGDYLKEPVFSIVRPTSSNNRPTRSSVIPSLHPAPMELEIVTSLMSLGIGWEEAWNLPIGQAQWLRPMSMRRDGKLIDFADQDEREFQSQLPPEFRHARSP